LAKGDAHTPGSSESLRAKKKRTSLNGRATAWPAKRFPQRMNKKKLFRPAASY